jgi:hypothetical protein
MMGGWFMVILVFGKKAAGGIINAPVCLSCVPE